MKKSVLPNRISTVFYKTFWESIKDLPEKNQIEVYNAIFELAFNFRETELSGLSNTIYRLIKPQIDANNNKFMNGVKYGHLGADHGNKGGRPKPPNNPQETLKEPSKRVNDETLKEPSQNPLMRNDNEECEMSNVNDNKQPLSKNKFLTDELISQIQNAYLQELPMLPRALAITGKRLTNLDKHVKKYEKSRCVEWWAEYFQTFADYDKARNGYYSGKGDGGWIADFEFVTRPATILKVVEWSNSND